MAGEVASGARANRSATNNDVFFFPIQLVLDEVEHCVRVFNDNISRSALASIHSVAGILDSHHVHPKVHPNVGQELLTATEVFSISMEVKEYFRGALGSLHEHAGDVDALLLLD